VVFSGAAEVFGLIGNPVSHSLSPIFWNAAFEAEKKDCVYVPFLVEESRLNEAVRGLSAISVKGFNVTAPFKEKICSFLDEIFSPAKEIGSVNSVKCLKDGKLHGYNTDYSALSSILDELPKLETVTLIGAGGAGKTILWGLCQRKVEVIYWANRNSDRLKIPFEKNVTDVRCIGWNYLFEAMKKSSLIINATTLGWSRDDDLPELGRALDKEKSFLDLNYSRSSKLTEYARRSGAKFIGGLEFLIRQGIESFRILTGCRPPETAIRESLKQWIL